MPMGFEGGTRLPRRKTRRQADNSDAATQSGARQPGICKVGDSSASASINIEKPPMFEVPFFGRAQPIRGSVHRLGQPEPTFNLRRLGQISTLMNELMPDWRLQDPV